MFCCAAKAFYVFLFDRNSFAIFKVKNLTFLNFMHSVGNG
jgi:hypothetical protein